MSYTGGDINMAPVGLGHLDIQAIRALYGNPSQDGRQVAKWSWSKTKQILTQIGKSKADVIYGVAVKDIIKGGHGNDKIYGFVGDDTLYGGIGNDVLSGGDGKDALQGGDGNDNLDGGFSRDTLQGGAGDDILKGGTGSDTLEGGIGSDEFVFDTSFSGVEDVDQIVDFEAGDKIVLSSVVFSTLAKGVLSSEAFFRGLSVHDADDRILFDLGGRSLSYDSDGFGPSTAVRFAHFLGTPTIDFSDFLIV